VDDVLSGLERVRAVAKAPLENDNISKSEFDNFMHDVNTLVPASRYTVVYRGVSGQSSGEVDSETREKIEDSLPGFTDDEFRCGVRDFAEIADLVPLRDDLPRSSDSNYLRPRMKSLAEDATPEDIISEENRLVAVDVSGRYQQPSTNLEPLYQSGYIGSDHHFGRQRRNGPKKDYEGDSVVLDISAFDDTEVDNDWI